MNTNKKFRSSNKHLFRHKNTFQLAMRLFVASLLLVFANAAKNNVDVKKSLVFGPAFEVDVVLPVRYFYIQLVDKRGKK